MHGRMDLFAVSSAKQGEKQNSLFLAGSDTNTSPNTTSLSKKPVTGTVASHVLGVNYSTVLVDETTDDTTPRPLVRDLHPDPKLTATTNGTNDLFINFSVPFSQIVAAAQSLGLTIDETSTIAFALVTATQNNSINQDVAGVGAKANGTNNPWNTPWSQIWVDPIAPVHMVPEAGLVSFSAGSFVMLMLSRRYRAKRCVTPARHVGPQRPQALDPSLAC